MNYGGPVWHASAASSVLGHDALEQVAAAKMLRGVGDAALGQWVDRSATASGKAVVHVRRRLTPAEERISGPVRDLRGTAEQSRRAHRLHARFRVVPLEVMLTEGW